MACGPGKKGKLQFRGRIKKPRSHQQKRKQIRGVNSREACAPEFHRVYRAALAGVDKDESGKHKKETHAHVADGRKFAEPCRSESYLHGLEMEQHHEKRREKSQRCKSGQSGPKNRCGYGARLAPNLVLNRFHRDTVFALLLTPEREVFS